MNEEIMDKLMQRAMEDEEFAYVFDMLMKASQLAAMKGLTMQEMATVCMTGWTIGNDPDLTQMVKHMAEISKLGLKITDK